MPEILTQREIDIKGKTAFGIELKLPHANLVLVLATKGYVCCGYLDLATAEKFSDAACIVRGVKTTDDLLEARITGITSFAQNLGINLGMTGRQALELLI
jgi:uncharacterized protein YunC (DUF1805 family)